jgi:hypothetical protein
MSIKSVPSTYSAWLRVSRPSARSSAPVQLDDPGRDLVGVLLLFVRITRNPARPGSAFIPRHEWVPPIAQHADDLGREASFRSLITVARPRDNPT